MQTASLAQLYRLLEREQSTLLHYLSGAWPWSSQTERTMVDQVQAIADAEQAALQRLAAHLRRQRIVPPGARFPMDFSHLHYIALSHLLPELVKESSDLLAELETATASDADLAELTGSFLELKRGNLAKLQALIEAHAGSKSLSTRR
ncbi:MAG TPA: hypothetical protein PKC45_02420 [Gemmatales bacterium]|nr:hypothetical protein [Gemmatales bacterium]